MIYLYLDFLTLNYPKKIKKKTILYSIFYHQKHCLKNVELLVCNMQTFCLKNIVLILCFLSTMPLEV